MSDIVSEIKSRLNIEDVVAQYVQLKPAGRNLKGLCPFHQEKTPSFMVSPEKELAYCFGCHKGGDMIAFVQEVEGIEFKEAVNILAEKCGLDLADYQMSSQSKHSKSEKEEIYEIHTKAAKFYSDLLWNTDDGKKVLGYLRNRGMSDDSIREFNFGLSPDSFDKTHLELVKSGYSRKILALSGMAISKDTNSDKVYDRFRRRLMIPIYDSLGRIVGFGGRALKKDDEPKYLNSSDSPIYKKSDVMYGYNFAKDSIKKSSKVLLVEGYFDVIMSYQMGIKNVVATSGTALTVQQIKLLKRLTKDLIFCFDTDKAGIAAAKRGFALAQKEGVNVRVLSVPGAKDPADYIKDHGEEWNQIIENTVPFMEFALNDALERNDPTKLDGKKAIMNEMIEYLLILSSSLEQDFYIREIAQKIDAKEVQIYDELKRAGESSSLKVRKKSVKTQEENKKFSLFDFILGLVYENPELLEDDFNGIDPEKLPEDEKSIYNTLKDNYNLLRAEDKRKEFLACFDDDVCKKLEVISLFIEESYGGFNENKIEIEFKALVNKLKNTWLDRQKRSLSREMREAEKNGEKDRAKELLQQFQSLVSS
ncbi:DNA primase [Patescibacteria group bacterium]